MIRLVMESSNLAHWPAISLVLFFVFTLGTIAWIYRKGSTETYRRLGQLALEDGEPVLATSGRNWVENSSPSKLVRPTADSKEVR